MKRIWKPALLLILCICVLSAISGGLSAKYKSTMEDVTFDLTVIKDLTGSVTIDNTKPIVGDELTVNTEKIDQKNVTFAYQWYRGEERIEGANAATYKVTIDDLGKTLKCEVTDQDGIYTGSVISDPTEAVKQLPIEGTVTLSPTPIAVVGEVVTAQVSGAPEDAVLAYQWYRGEEEITGATESTHTPVEDDYSKMLKCVVTDTSGRYEGSLSATVYVGKMYTYAVLGEDNSLSIRNRAAYIVTATDGTQQLVDKDGTYTLGENGVVYALPESFVAGNVPTDAISSQWRVGYNTNNTFEQSITSVIVEDKIALADSGTTYMFQSFTALKTVNLEKVDFSKATSLEGMFDNCNQMTSVKFAADIDTSSVTSMYKLFYLCKNLTDLDVTGLDTGAVKNMSHMFDTCSSLTVLNVTGFNTAQVTDMSFMFADCSKVTSLNVSNFKTSNVKNMTNMFASCSGLTELDVTKFDTGNVQNMDSFVAMCSGLTALDVSKMNTQSVTNMRNMFARCTGLTTLDIREWNTPNLQNTSLMFTGCTNLSTLLWDDSFNTSKVTDMEGMFQSCVSFTTLDLTSFSTSEVKNMKNMFNGFHATSLNISNFDTSNVTTMESMFRGCNLTTLDLGSFNTEKVTNMRLMFFSCTSLTALDLSNFTTTSLLTDMREMFYQCGQLTELDLSGFDTSKVKDMNNLFGQCKKLTTIYVSDKFVTDSVTDSTKIFDQCSVLKGVNGTVWSVSDIAYAIIDGANGQPGYFTLKGNATSFITLNVTVDESVATGCILPTYNYPSKDTIITLTTAEGDSLPESVTVMAIDGNGNPLLDADGTEIGPITYTNGDGRYDSSTGKLTIPGSMVKANVSITISTPAETQVLEDGGLVHLTATCDPAEIVPGQPFTITLTPDAGYVLPATVTVTINGEDKTAEVTYENGVITIPAELVTEGISISVTAEAKQQISVTTVFTSDLTVTCNPIVPIPGEAFTVTLTGEVLPGGVTVTIDGVEATAAVYDKASGTITIPGELLTDTTTSITITAATPEAITAICNCTSKCEEGTVNSDCPVCGTTPENCSPVICNCETLCAEDAVNTECPVCSTTPENCRPKEPETTAECVCTVTCTEGAVNADCEVCAADWSKCGIQADPAPTEATPTITVNTNGISGLSFSPDAAPAINQDYTAGMAPVEGYTLPESITVTIGADRYTVNLNGENEDGKPDFEGGKLIIPGTLLTVETTITIEATGVAVPADEDNSNEDNSGEDNSSEETQPTGNEETQPPADDSTQPTGGEDTQPSADESTQPPAGEDTQPPADDNTQTPADNGTQPPAGGNDDVPEQPEQPEATEGGSTGVDPPTE